MGERRDAFKVLQGTPVRRRPLGRLDDRIILKLMFNEWGGETDLIDLAQDY
jgi:hypothetical protein